MKSEKGGSLSVQKFFEIDIRYYMACEFYVKGGYCFLREKKYQVFFFVGIKVDRLF